MIKEEVRFTVDHLKVISELEAVFCIDGNDYVNRDIDNALRNILQRIQVQYSIEFEENQVTPYNGAIYSEEEKNFIDIVYTLYEKLCAIAHSIRYRGKVPYSLSSVNYIGITKDSLLNLLKLVQMEGSQTKAGIYMEDVKYRLTSVPITPERRLFTLMVLSYILKLYEVTAVIAELLYLGGYHDS